MRKGSTIIDFDIMPDPDIDPEDPNLTTSPEDELSAIRQNLDDAVGSGSLDLPEELGTVQQYFAVSNIVPATPEAEAE